MKKNLIRIFAFLMVLCILGSLVLPASASGTPTINESLFDADALCHLNIYKYDFTNAAKDGVWSVESYVSTGQYDKNVNDILGGAIRKGSNNASSALDANGNSNGYAIKGVEFTHLKVAEIVQFNRNVQDDTAETATSDIELLYKFNKEKAGKLLLAIGLGGGKDSVENANKEDDTAWFYRSDVLNAALQAALNENSTTVKSALEDYIKSAGGTAMDLTDADGFTAAEDLPVGLYLIVETKVPEMVTSTVNPFFVSLPMTDVSGENWMYDVTIYPKNETGIVSLSKEVREAKASSGKNNGSAAIDDGFAHTATASAGDKLEYQIISTLPTITSSATDISVWKYVDQISEGISYNKGLKDVKIEVFTDKACTDKVTEWVQDDGNFTVTYSSDNQVMTIAVTETGLAKINGETANANGKLYKGYSNYTLRITYSAQMNSDESLVYGDAGNVNKVVLTWARTSSEYYDTLVDDCHVYTYGINLTKVFSDDKNEQKMFDAVRFNIKNAKDGYYVIAELDKSAGVWYVTGYTDNKTDATKFNPVTWNNKKGQIVVKGLEDDAYVLSELSTYAGYTLLKDDVDVVITAKEGNDACSIYSEDILGVIQNDSRYNFDGNMDLKLSNIAQAAMSHNHLTASATVDTKAVSMVKDNLDTDSKNALAPLTVVNTQGFDLPQTGQTGAKWMPIIGGAIIGLAAIGLVVVMFYKRKEDEAKTKA